MIARRCATVWTAGDDRSFHESLAELRADIDAHGGLEGWLKHGIEDWLLPERGCPVRAHHVHA
jgi:hypothetical protein